jgi:hypothetical protein
MVFSSRVMAPHRNCIVITWSNPPLDVDLVMISRWIGFEVNVPGQLKQLHPEANITAQGGAWALDALDPLFTKLSDACVRAA